MPFGGYPNPSRDYNYYGAPVKRQRTSVDFGNRGLYDADGRMRQMDTYPQAATMFSNPPGPYQTPMMSGYTGHAGVPDYAVRQPTMVSSTYGPSEDPMLAVRSPGSAYVSHYPTYNEAQMSYGIPPGAQVPQVADPSASNRSNQQATMQSLMPVNQPGTPVCTLCQLICSG